MRIGSHGEIAAEVVGRDWRRCSRSDPEGDLAYPVGCTIRGNGPWIAKRRSGSINIVDLRFCPAIIEQGDDIPIGGEAQGIGARDRSERKGEGRRAAVWAETWVGWTGIGLRTAKHRNPRRTIIAVEEQIERMVGNA